MNFLGANNQNTVIFGYSPNNEIRFSDFTFVTRYSYNGNNWFHGTNGDYNGLQDKLTDSDWTLYGIDSIRLYFDSITINGVYYDGGYNEIFYAEDYSAYSYRNDGYGLGFSSYIDQLNIILQNYQLRTRFYPALSNHIIGIINTAENFEVSLPEFAGNIDVQSNFLIKCVYGEVYDSLDGGIEVQWS